MIPLAFAGLLAAPVIVAAADNNLDVGTMIASYGIAAPFALLCWWQMQRSQSKLDKAEEQIAKLQAEAVTNAREFAARFAPILYDAGLLYKQGNERLTQGLSQSQESEVHRLREEVEELVRKITDK